MGEAELHSFASLMDTEFDIAVEEYNVPIEIEDDADATATNVADGDAGDADGGETHADTGSSTVDAVGDGNTQSGNDVIDAVDGDAGETNAGNGIVDTVDSDATNTAATEEVTESPNTTSGSNGLRRHLNGTNTTSSPVTLDEEKEGGGELEEEEEPEEENADAVSEIEENDEADPVRKAVEGGAKGANVTLSAMLQTESNIRIEMWLISSGGAVGTTSEQWAVQPGDTKFNIQLTHWTFCDPCTDGTGEFVDVQIQIKGKKEGGPKAKEKGARIENADRKDGKGKKDESDKEEGNIGKKQRKEHAWDLGEGTTLDLTSRVRVDGLWTDMPEGFPKLINEGGKQHYTLRFPRFTDNIWYDPVVSFDEDFDSATSAAISRFVSYTACGGAMLLAYTLL